MVIIYHEEIPEHILANSGSCLWFLLSIPLYHCGMLCRYTLCGWCTVNTLHIAAKPGVILSPTTLHCSFSVHACALSGHHMICVWLLPLQNILIHVVCTLLCSVERDLHCRLTMFYRAILRLIHCPFNQGVTVIPVPLTKSTSVWKRDPPPPPKKKMFHTGGGPVWPISFFWPL